MKNNSSGSTFLAVLCTFGVLIMIGMIGDAMTPKCSKSGCDRDRADGSNYCYLHKSYSSRYSSGKRSTNSRGSSSSTSKSSNGSSATKSSGASNSSSSSASSSTGSSFTSSSSKKHSSTSKKNSLSSYDDGYEAIYEDGDYDGDRYQTDSDYANGVDDAMDELDW